MARQKKSLEEKIQETLPEFYDSAIAMDTEEIKRQIARDAIGRVENQIAKEADEALEQAQAQASFLASPYNDAEKMLKLKAQFLKKLLDEKGGSAS